MDRVNGLLREEISDLLRRHLKDPRLTGFITITAVDTSVDLHYAKVYVSVLGSAEERQEALRGFSSATGYLRRELRERLSLRRIPELQFLLDTSLERGAHLLELMSKVVSKEDPKSKGP
jgi:ribosome-binding factor A